MVIEHEDLLKDKWNYTGSCCRGTKNYSYKTDGTLRIKIYRNGKFDMFFKGRRTLGQRVISEWGRQLNELESVLQNHEL